MLSVGDCSNTGCVRASFQTGDSGYPSSMGCQKRSEANHYAGKLSS